MHACLHACELGWDIYIYCDRSSIVRLLNRPNDSEPTTTVHYNRKRCESNMCDSINGSLITTVKVRSNHQTHFVKKCGEVE